MLLLDVSGSVRPILHQIRDGALNALQRLKPKDQVAIMAFANTSRLAQNFTNDRKLAAQKIEEATASDVLGRGTFLGPALDSAAIHMRRAPAQAGRRVIIVVTDNIAITTGRQTKDILEELFDSGTVVYGLIVRAAIGKVFNVMFLGQIKGVNEFVEQTGGEIVGADKTEVDEKLGAVLDRLRARYAIGFRPTCTTDDGKFRKVEIKVVAAKKGKENLIVLTKPHAASEPITPPVNPITAASKKKINLISRSSAPIAFMIPISRVRSRMDMIIVLAIPNEATRSEMPPSNPSTASIIKNTVRICSI